MAFTGIYELEDFKENPKLTENDDICMNFISSIIFSLRSNFPLIGDMLTICNKVLDRNLKSSGAVSLDENGYKLIINPTYFSKDDYTLDIFLFVLKHEALHLIFGHLVNYRKDFKNDYKKLQAINIGTDCTINQNKYIDKRSVIANRSITLEVVEKLLFELTGNFEKLQPFYSSDYYIDKINSALAFALSRKEDVDEDMYEDVTKSTEEDTKENDSYEDDFAKQLARELLQENYHDHLMWFIDEVDTEKLEKSIIEQLLSSPIGDKSMENLVIAMSKYLGEEFHNLWKNKGQLITLPNLKSTLSRLVRQKPVYRKSFLKIKKIYGSNVIGKNVKRIKSKSYQVMVYGDTSGSMDIVAINDILTTITHKYREVEFTFKLFSDFVYEFKEDKYYHGGTCIQNVFDDLQQNNIDKKTLVVIMTDGYFDKIFKTHGYDNVHWLLIGANVTTSSIPFNHKFTKITIK